MLDDDEESSPPVPRLLPVFVPLKPLQIEWDLLPTEKTKVDNNFANKHCYICPYFDYQNCHDDSGNVISNFPNKNNDNIETAKTAIQHSIEKLKQFDKEELQKEALAQCKNFDLRLDNGQEPANIAGNFKIFKSDTWSKRLQKISMNTFASHTLFSGVSILVKILIGFIEQ